MKTMSMGYFTTDIDRLEEENEQLKNRIDKAIEYIENHSLTCNENWLIQYEKELLGILKGKSE